MRGLSIEQRQRIVNKYGSVKNISMRKLAKEEGVSFCAVQNTIKRFGQYYSLEDLPGRGKKPGATRQDLEKKIVQQFAKKKGISVRDCAKKCGTSIGMVQRAKQRNSLKTYRKQKQPKRSSIQSASVKTRARKLYDQILSKKDQCIIMDDETYVKFDYKTLPGAQYYTVKKGLTVPNEEKSIFCEKFGKKILVWQAICQCGLKSTPFFSIGTLNAEIYRNECLKKRLLPLVRKHNTPTLFWPDLASCHYATSVRQWYDENDIHYVAKDMNPPNCPEVRPIEKFWALMKSKLRKNVKPANDLEKFKRDWNRVAKTVDASVVQNLMENIKRKVRKLGY